MHKGKLTFDMTLYLLALFPPLSGGLRGVGVLSEWASGSPTVLGGVVLSEAASPKVVEDLLACRESPELELELFFDLLECEKRRRWLRKEGGIAKVCSTAHSGRLLRLLLSQ